MTPSPGEVRILGVVGLGLIGGSIGLAARAQGIRVVGADASEEHRRLARQLGLVDELGSLSTLASRCDLVVVAVPPSGVLTVANELLARGAKIVTDTCSAKRTVVDALADHPNFVGSHPMAGAEVSGPASSRLALFKDAAWAVTPGRMTSREAVTTVSAFVLRLGARPILIDAADHDHHVAFTSHLPHAAASALAQVVAAESEGVAQLAGPGFVTTTRVAEGSEQLWSEILLTNADEVRSALKHLRAALDDLGELIERADRPGLAEWLARGAEGRRHVLGVASDGSAERPGSARAA